MLFCTAISYSQKEIECIYTVYTTVDTNKEAQKSTLSETILRSKPLDYKLVIKDDVAFYSENISLFNEGLDQQSIKLRRIISSGGIESVTATLRDGRLTKRIENRGSFYCIKTAIADNKWEITEETKIIDTYKCYKAILTVENLDRQGNSVEQKIIAYFSPSLPFRAGPLDYYGLPGLILEVQDKSKLIQLKSINFEASKDFLVLKEKKCDVAFDSQMEYEKFIYNEGKKL